MESKVEYQERIICQRARVAVIQRSYADPDLVKEVLKDYEESGLLDCLGAACGVRCRERYNSTVTINNVESPREIRKSLDRIAEQMKRHTPGL